MASSFGRGFDSLQLHKLRVIRPWASIIQGRILFRRVMYAITHVSFLMCVEYISLFCIGNSCFLRKDACLKMNVILLFND